MAIATEVRVEVTRKTFDFLKDSDKRINILYGSAGSTKSWSIAQFLLLCKFYQEHDIRILCVRKTGPALRKSCWLLINDLIAKYDLPRPVSNKSELSLRYGSNIMFFAPLDDPEKFKSFEKVNYIWVEEATEINLHEYLQLGLRCRGENPNGINQLFFSFNPVDENSFWKEIVETPAENIAVQHSVYQDNRFLESEYVEELERLKEIDETYWKIYGEGIWATPQNIIYTNWDIIDEAPVKFDEIIYGVDFGWNNESAIIQVGIYDDEIYLDELLYEKGLTNSDLIEKMRELEIGKDSLIYADAAEPDRIEEIQRAGYIIKECKKGQGSVQKGIDVVKTRKMHVWHTADNILKEFRGYKWREDRNGNVLDEPVKFRDHLMDALRYALYTHMGKPPVRFEWI